MSPSDIRGSGRRFSEADLACPGFSRTLEIPKTVGRCAFNPTLILDLRDRGWTPVDRTSESPFTGRPAQVNELSQTVRVNACLLLSPVHLPGAFFMFGTRSTGTIPRKEGYGNANKGIGS